MAIVQIKHRFTGAGLFECDVPAEVESGLALRHALEKATKVRADLRDADLSGADLSGAYLRGAYLSGADLRDADLRDADLSGAYLRDAYLSDAYLSGAYLSGAYLSGAYLSGAYLSGADLSGADLRGADLRGAYLRGADLSGAYLRGADLRGADLRGADLSGEAKHATDEQATENLDRVRAIILDNKARLEMGHWHQNDEWQDRTCAEETLCSTTHCLAGWLQVCSTDEEIRKMDSPQLAGTFSAPVAAKMFFRQGDEVLSWLEDRKYVGEMQKSAERRAALKAKREAEQSA